MFRHIDSFDDSFTQNDKDYNRILKELNYFTDGLPTADKELLFKMVNNVYYKCQRSILTYSKSDTELMLSLVMALIVEQNKELSTFKKKTN